MDAIKYLKQQHRRIEALFSRYERSPNRRKEIAGQIERAIIPHAIIEEMHIYPRIRERAPGGVQLSEHAIGEHAEVERTLKRMSSMNEQSAEFDNAMRRVIDSVSHHVYEEEDNPGLLEMLRTALTRQELNELGRTLKTAHDMAPTRAHPLAPDHPPANKLLGPAVAVIDRLRDTLEGREESGEGRPGRATGRHRSPTRARRRRTSSRKRTSAKHRTRSHGSRSTRGKRAAPRRRTATRGKAARRHSRTVAKSRRR